MRSTILNIRTIHIPALLIFLLTSTVLKAQTRTASVSGNWSNTATWGGASVPTSANAVVINNAITVTVNADATCASITFPSDNANNTNLNISSGVILSVTGAVTIPRAEIGTTILNKVAVGDGNLNAGSIAFTNGGGTVRHEITINTGTVTVTGNVTESGSNGSASITFTGAGLLKLGGSFLTNNTGTLTQGTGTVEYNAAGTQTIGDFTYNNLTLSGSGIKTMSASTTIAGNLSIGAGTTLDEAGVTTTLGSGSVLTVNGTLDFSNTSGLIRTGSNVNAVLTMGSAGLIKTADANGLGPVAGASLQVQGTGSWTTSSLDNNGTVEYNAIASQALTDRNYNNLSISTSAGIKTWTLGATRTINGTLTISANTPFTFAGGVRTLNLKGNWINNSTGTFTPASVTVNLNGSTAQTIGGTQSTSFGALTINNAAGVSLSGNTTVTGLLTLTNGIISVGSNIFTVSSTGTLSGGSISSFINGPMAKTGTSAFIFPVGKSGAGIRTLAISAPTVSSTFTAEFFRSDPHTIDTTLGSGIKWISDCEYWTLDRSGTGNASVTLSWTSGSACNSNGYVTDMSILRVAHWNGSSWANEGNLSITGDPSAGTVTSGAALTSFSPFALGTSTFTTNPLPVMFADVKEYEKNGGVQIEWSNMTERDLVNYVVERSANGVNFTTISQQLPRSNQNDKESYSAFDAAPFSGTSFYRIKAIEISGKIIYSKVIRADIGRTKKGFTMYPNPVKGNQVSVSLNAKQGQYTIKVLNTSGQEVYSQRITHQGGSMSQAIELPSMAMPGVYNMMISGDNYREAKMFVVQ